MNLNNLIETASFRPVLPSGPSAWMGHLHFAAWVIREVKPHIFVELGTHAGHSYFSFCQSVAGSGLPTKCFAVDTWEGDGITTGQYGAEIFNAVNAFNQERYASFSRLLRMSFDDALTYFSEKSISLLHIDGLHTYEAVRHDFETWLPKLAPGAVVLFHDTKVYAENFGVHKLWGELTESYPSNLEFVHSCGLGVMQLNDALSDDKLSWLQPDYPEKQMLINYFAGLGEREYERYDLAILKTKLSQLENIVADQVEKKYIYLANRLKLEQVAHLDIDAHISNVGDVSFWPCQEVSVQTENFIEGITIYPSSNLFCWRDISYQVMFEDGTVSEMVLGGQFSGTRHQARKIVGFRMSAKSEQDFQLFYEGEFEDGSTQRVANNSWLQDSLKPLKRIRFDIQI